MFLYQEYFGERVDWCFCEGKDGDPEPCNAASHEDIEKLRVYDRNEPLIVGKPINDADVYNDLQHVSYDLLDDRVQNHHFENTKRSAYSDWTRSIPEVERASKQERLTAQRGKHEYEYDRGTYFYPGILTCHWSVFSVSRTA